MDKNRSVAFSCDEHRLIGDFSSDTEKQASNILCLHGAGGSDRHRYAWLREILAEKGIDSFAFDFSGHGESSGELQQSSLYQRQQEALAAIDLMNPSTDLTVMGASMGGHIALSLLGKVAIKNIILFCPAVYCDDAFSIGFDLGFTDIIRQEDSRKNSSLWKSLSGFEGNLLVFIGEEDEVIPGGVIDMIDRSATHCKYKRIHRFPGVGHQLHTWLSENDHDANLVVEDILQHVV